MKKIILFIICLSLFPLGIGATEKLQKITLKDNSVIIGTVLGMNNGIYSVESTTLGKLSLKADNIVEIRALGANEDSSGKRNSGDGSKISIRDGARKKTRKSPAREKYEKSVGQGSNDLNRQQEEVNSRVKSMTADGGFLDTMMDISENSSMMDVMSDPEVMEAISNNDYDFLMNNEKMKSLMESQDIKNLLGDVQP